MMMGSEEEEDWFSDAREEVSDYNSQVEVEEEEFVQATGDLDLWTMNPDSVCNRRHKFFQSMGFSFKKRPSDHLHNDPSPGDDVINNIPVSQQPLNSVSETDHNDDEEDHEKKLSRNDSVSSSQSDTSSSSVSTPSRFRGGAGGGGRFLDRAKHIVDDRIFLTRDCSSNSNSSSSIALSESSSSRSSDFPSSRYEDSPKKGGAKGWLKKLGVLTHVLDKTEDTLEDGGESLGSSSSTRRRRQLTRVQSFKKQFKELSSLCVGQEFSAHDGSVVVMKFSHDGSYLATAGEDSVVRVWTVSEEERRDNMFEVVEPDSSSTSNSVVYFGMNDDKSQIEPLNVENEKVEKMSRSLLLRKKSESTCAVLPSKVFTISETPLHEFRGHAGEILDLSWSDKGFLLSSSVDETVRLWRVGSSDECLRVFSHKSFVTCVAFNPVDDNYFISGSTDGKVRIWDVSRVRVVDYTDIKEIVTALCYRPDAKGVVVGSMAGECLFYHATDNQLELDKEISLHGGKKKTKKKSKVPSKRITGFQFFPGDSDNKLMVTSADSQIRIISGVDTICKLKKASSLRATLSPTSALFTSDAKHIVSTIEDSGIHVWDYSQPNKKASSPPHKPKTIRSYEGFLSDNVSVAIPWLGQQGKEEDSVCSFIADLDKKFAHLPLPVRDCFSQLKGATTWPEEKLGLVAAGSAAAAISATASSRSKLRLLRSVCQNVNSTGTPHLWGLVIVTATWDGRIRVFHNYGLPIRV